MGPRDEPIASMGVDVTLTGTRVTPAPPSSVDASLADGSPGDLQTGPAAVPDTFDGYVLIRPLGRGGMGEVFLARDTVLDRAFSVKLIAATAPGPISR